MSDSLTSDPSDMTAAQLECDECGHDWKHFPYEYDTNGGGYMECRLCGWTEADDGGFGGDEYE